MTDIEDPKNASVPNTGGTDTPLEFDTWDELLFHFYGAGPYYSWHYEDLIRSGIKPRHES